MSKILRTSGDYTVKAGDGFNSGSGTNTITLDSQLVSVSGNLTVAGTTTTVNTTNTVVADNIIELNSGISSSNNDAGIIIERGSTGDNAAIVWDESADSFVLGTTTATGADKSGGISVTAGSLTIGNLITADITANSLSTNEISSRGSNADINIQPSGTGNLVTTNINANSLTTNVISSNGSNADISIQASGTGDVLLSALRVNGTTLDSSDSTKITLAEAVDITGETTLVGGDLVTNGNRITHANSGTVSFLDFTKTLFSETNHTVLSSVKSIDFFLDSNGGDSGQAFRIYNNTNPDGSVTEGNHIFKVDESGNVSLSGKITLPDGDVSSNYAAFGDSEDLKIFHNGTHSIVREVGTGDLFLQSDNNVVLSKDTSTEIMVKGIADGAVELYHDNVKKFETTATGATVSGDLATEGISITDNNISASRSNDDLVLSPNGTGAVKTTATVHVGAFVGGIDILTGGGAIRTDTLTTEIVTTGAQAFSLADGALGQIKILNMKTHGGTATITPATFSNATNILFNAKDDNVTLCFTSNGWVIIAGQSFTTS